MFFVVGTENEEVERSKRSRSRRGGGVELIEAAPERRCSSRYRKRGASFFLASSRVHCVLSPHVGADHVIGHPFGGVDRRRAVSENHARRCPIENERTSGAATAARERRSSLDEQKKLDQSLSASGLHSRVKRPSRVPATSPVRRRDTHTSQRGRNVPILATTGAGAGGEADEG